MLRTIGFPSRYFQGPNALQQLGTLLKKMGFQKPLTLCDAVVTDKVWPAVADSMQAAQMHAACILFPGECTSAAIDALAAQAKGESPDVIIGLGGGKTADAAKGIALALGLDVVICPTIASNDAPTSRLIVLYDEAHRVVNVRALKTNPVAVVVDTAIIAQAPARFFAAGIGDTVSKKFEAAQCKASQGKNAFGTAPLDTALLLATASYETLVRHGPAAYLAITRGELDEDVERVIEATVLLSGVGFESGGLSLAHALASGLTAVPAMARMLHGELVAFGALVQVVVEDRDDAQIAELLGLLHAVHLPVTLAQLGQIAPLTQAEMAAIVAATLDVASSKFMNPPLTAQGLEAALLKADAIGAALQSRLCEREK